MTPLPRPRQPAGRWLLRDTLPVPGGDPALVYDLPGSRLQVFSQVAPLPDGNPAWMVACSRGMGRPSDSDMELVRTAFGMRNAIEAEDPVGSARFLVLPCDDEVRR